MAKQQHQMILTALGGAFGLLLAYAFASRALSTGSYWQYLGFALFLTLSVKLLFRTFKKRS